MGIAEVGCTWPESEAAEKWWAAHSLELKTAMTAYRLEQQHESAARIQTLERALAKAEAALIER